MLKTTKTIHGSLVFRSLVKLLCVVLFVTNIVVTIFPVQVNFSSSQDWACTQSLASGSTLQEFGKLRTSSHSVWVPTFLCKQTVTKRPAALPLVTDSWWGALIVTFYALGTLEHHFQHMYLMMWTGTFQLKPQCVPNPNQAALMLKPSQIIK